MDWIPSGYEYHIQSEAARLQDGLQQSSLPGIYSAGQSLCDHKNWAEKSVFTSEMRLEKTMASVLMSVSLSQFILWEASCQVISSSTQRSMSQRTEASCLQLLEWTWQRIPWAQSSLQVTTALADRLTATSSETLSQKLPAKALPNSRPSGTL